ncbi:hypothetical protein [Spirosoma koreense]
MSRSLKSARTLFILVAVLVSILLAYMLTDYNALSELLLKLFDHLKPDK